MQLSWRRAVRDKTLIISLLYTDAFPWRAYTATVYRVVHFLANVQLTDRAVITATHTATPGLLLHVLP